MCPHGSPRQRAILCTNLALSFQACRRRILPERGVERLGQRGAQLRRVEGETGRYDMVLAEMDDAVFQFTVLERVEGVRHALSAVMVPQLFALEKSIEEHVIEPLGETACRVTLKTSATFDAGLSDDEMASEIAVMGTAVARDLEKLKLLAEEGLEAVREAEQAEMEFDLGFELGELDIDWDDIEPEH